MKRCLFQFRDRLLVQIAVVTLRAALPSAAAEGTVFPGTTWQEATPESQGGIQRTSAEH
jgi:hypothetical protein